MEFFFEKLEVYKRALDLIEATDSIIESIRGRFPSSRIDQLTRATLSIPLNIAEGNGRRRPKERGHFLVIARGSAFEVVAILEILKRKGLISAGDYAARYADLHVICKMLSGLIKHVESKTEQNMHLPPTAPISRPAEVRQ
jgi:four helix bundle protein